MFYEKHPEAEQALKLWHREAKKADWRTPQAVKAHYGNASVLPGRRIVFNIAGNKDRLVVKINFVCGIVYIRFVGTHKQYDAVDASSI